ncbi:MAG: hypothetical protein JJ896_12480 [Rhodothermales bacterium]|nr:hypothetical protein [Rhodothermales bacterium]MBO6780462.1 hypothetical protein [Rhodothermales bacterium]
MIKPTHTRVYAPGLEARMAPTRRQRPAPDSARPGADPTAPNAPSPLPGKRAGDSPAAARSPEERHMIEAQFPETKRMSLRLYGPARPASQVEHSLGSFIDLKG